MRMLLFLLLIVFNAHPVVAKSDVRLYKEFKDWKVVSGHEKGKQLAFVCTVLSKKKSFYLSYSEKRGWVLSIGYTRIPQVTTEWVKASIYINENYLSTRDIHIDKKNKFLRLDIKIDGDLLFKIVDAKLIQFGFGGEKLGLNLSGLKQAFNSSLGCWKNRMGAVAYKSPQKTGEAFKPKRFVNIEKLILNELLTSSKLSHLVMKESFVYIKGYEDSVSNHVGYAFVQDLHGKRFSPKQMVENIDDMVTKGTKACDNLGIKKVIPYFTRNRVEVYSRSTVCSVRDNEAVSMMYWALQSENYYTTIYLMVSGLDGDSNFDPRRSIERISKFLN